MRARPNLGQLQRIHADQEITLLYQEQTAAEIQLHERGGELIRPRQHGAAGGVDACQSPVAIEPEEAAVRVGLQTRRRFSDRPAALLLTGGGVHGHDRTRDAERRIQRHVPEEEFVGNRRVPIAAVTCNACVPSCTEVNVSRSSVHSA